jgi:hypothetical protein
MGGWLGANRVIKSEFLWHEARIGVKISGQFAVMVIRNLYDRPVCRYAASLSELMLRIFWV